MKKLPKNLSYQIINFFALLFFFVPVFLWLPKTNILLTIFSSSIVILMAILFCRVVGQVTILKILEEFHEIKAPGWKYFIIGVSVLTGFWLTLNIPLVSPPVERTPFLSPLIVRMSYRFLSALGIGLLFFILLLMVGRRREVGKGKNNDKESPYSFLKYFLVMVFVWGVYLLAFYPGMMSADSFNQWKQVLTGVYNDHHPPFHTFTIWLVTRIAFTPTSVAVAQIFFLGFVAAHWFVFFKQIGIPKWLIWVGMSIFSLSPVNGTMVNTLWKDVPFSTSVLALSLLLTKIVFSGGQWIQSWKAKILLGITCALVLLFRHDGLPLGVGTIAALFVFYPGKWKSWAMTTIVCLGLYFGVRGPIYQLVGVQKTTVLAESSLSLYSMAAYAREGSQAEQLINTFQIISPTWECSLAGKIQPEWRSTDLDYSLSPLEVAINLVQRMPRVLLYFYRCARSMEWIVWDPYGEVRNASHVEVLVDANPYGIQHDSKIPWLRDIIRNWVIKTSHNPNINWFTWRPALFLYVHLFINLILVLRNRSIRFGLISLPVVLQSITFSLIFAEPNFRYHYAVYLVSLISWPLLFLPPLQVEEKSES